MEELEKTIALLIVMICLAGCCCLIMVLQNWRKIKKLNQIHEDLNELKILLGNKDPQ